jgi:triacylglycerol lipase
MESASTDTTPSSVMPAEALDLPLWREAGAVLEWLRLHVSPVYTGRGVAAGDGSPVLLIPGFLCTDVHMLELNRWLAHVGYEPWASGVRLNARCLDTLRRSLATRLDVICDATGEPVHLVGHSLGGLLARSVATYRPECVASVVVMGSPFRQIRSHSLVLAASRVLSTLQSVLPGCPPGCMTSACPCPAVQQADGFPDHVPFTAIFTRDDAVVDWQSCCTECEEQDVEVSGTHMGLMYNPDAYRAIAEHLAVHTQRRTRAAA